MDRFQRKASSYKFNFMINPVNEKLSKKANIKKFSKTLKGYICWDNFVSTSLISTMLGWSHGP